MKKIGSKVNESDFPLQHKEIILRKQRALISKLLSECDDLFFQNFTENGKKFTSSVELYVLEPEEVQDYIEFSIEREEWKKWRDSKKSISFTVESKIDEFDEKKIFNEITKLYVK